MRRRKFIKYSTLGTAGALVIPQIIPAHVLGKNPPNSKIQIGQIGFGRIASSHDLPETIKNMDLARVVAVADVDQKRVEQGQKWVQDYYKKITKSDDYMNVATYQDYRELLADPSIDAVIISTPDHWHAQPAMEAALSGKDIYLQKPTSLTIEEGRMMSDTIHRTGAVFQLGSQQRSMNPWPQFHKACELVRNGRIGRIKRVEVGLPGDPSGDKEPKMPIPQNLNYDMWLGSTPEVYYTENRAHPQDGFSRPGWLRCEQFGAGMITGWGVHHIDIAHWGMGTEFTGPTEMEAIAQFPKSGLWNVHGDFKVKAKYDNGAEMEVSGDFPNGIKFIGTDGWIFVTRGNAKVTASDPTSSNSGQSPIQASDPEILTSNIESDEIHLYESPEQHRNWLDCIKSRELTISPAEVAHRSCSACLVFHIAMKIPGTLYWDPEKERFRNNDLANTMLTRNQRYPYGTHYAKNHLKPFNHD